MIILQANIYNIFKYSFLPIIELENHCLNYIIMYIFCLVTIPDLRCITDREITLSLMQVTQQSL